MEPSAAAIANIIAGLALVISAVAIIRSGITANKQTRLHEEQTRIAKQLADWEAADRAAALRADVRVTLEPRGGRDAYAFYVVNHGPGAARDVGLTLSSSKSGCNPIRPQDAEEMFPIAIMDVGDPLKINAQLSTGVCVPPFTGTLSWRDEDGTSRRKEITVYFG